MEFTSDDLDRILMDLFNIPCAPASNSTNGNISPTVKEESSSSDEQQQQQQQQEQRQQTTVINDNTIDREYLFIVFNNRHWSQSLQRRRVPRAPPTSPSQVIDHAFHYNDIKFPFSPNHHKLVMVNRIVTTIQPPKLNRRTVHWIVYSLMSYDNSLIIIWPILDDHFQSRAFSTSHLIQQENNILFFLKHY